MLTNELGFNLASCYTTLDDLYTVLKIAYFVPSIELIRSKPDVKRRGQAGTQPSSWSWTEVTKRKQEITRLV